MTIDNNSMNFKLFTGWSPSKSFKPEISCYAFYFTYRNWIEFGNKIL